MCEPIFTLSESLTAIEENACQPTKSSTLPLTAEDCKCKQSTLSEFANQIQFQISQRAKLNAMKKGNNTSKCDSSMKCMLQRLPDYHNIDLDEQCEPEYVAQVDQNDARNACIAQDCDLACAGARYVTFRIDKDPGSDAFEPLVVQESSPGLAAYVKQILKENSARNAIYGIQFEPNYTSARRTKKNQYEILYPSLIENLLNKLFSSSSLSSEDLEKFSNFIITASRLNVKDLDAYFRMLRRRGVVLASVVDNFRKQFWQLKSVVMSRKQVANFLKNLKHAVLFGDPNEMRKRKEKSAKQLARALEEALQQAEQWARELLGKKLTWSAGKSSAIQITKIDEQQPHATISSKPSATTTQAQKANQMTKIENKFDEQMELDTTPKPLVIRKETDPKFQLKKDDSSKEHGGATEAENEAAKRGSKKKDSKVNQDAVEKNDEARAPTQGKSKKEKETAEGKLAKQQKRGTNLQDSVGKKDESSAQQSQPVMPVFLHKSEETKDDRGRDAVKREQGSASRATSQEPSTNKGAKKEKKSDAKAIEPKVDSFKNTVVTVAAAAAAAVDVLDRMSTKSMRMVREPEREFRMRLAAALSAAQKYADKTLYIPDSHGVEDMPRGTKRYVTDISDGEHMSTLRRSDSKFYNDSVQLFERFSFLTTGAHKQGYYEPWGVEFPWPDLQALVKHMLRFYIKRLPDPNFSYRRGMEYYQSIFRRELEEARQSIASNEKTGSKGPKKMK